MLKSVRYANGRDCPMCREDHSVATQREAPGTADPGRHWARTAGQRMSMAEEAARCARICPATQTFRAVL